MSDTIDCTRCGGWINRGPVGEKMCKCYFSAWPKRSEPPPCPGCERLREVLKQLEFADALGCCDGDCPHENNADCVMALIDDLRSVADSARAALKANVPEEQVVAGRKAESVDLFLHSHADTGEFLGIDWSNPPGKRLDVIGGTRSTPLIFCSKSWRILSPR